MTPPHRTWSAHRPILLGLATLLVLLAGLGAWSVTARIDGAVLAQGVVSAQGNRQVLRHPEGGRVQAILARDGDRVEAGETVLQLDPSRLRSELAIIETHLVDARARAARLKAERDLLPEMALAQDLRAHAANRPEVEAQISGQSRLFHARRLGLDQQRAQLDAKIRQIDEEITGVAAQRTALVTQKDIIASEIVDQTGLVARGLAQTNRLSALRREHARLSGDIGRHTATIARHRGEIAELELQRLQLVAQFREDAMTQLRDLESHLLELAERRLALRDRLSLTELRSPVSGRILDSQVFAAGAVIAPTAPILTVVPDQHPPLIRARLDPAHLDRVWPGQTAELRFPSLDAARTPRVTGRVGYISADTVQDPSTGEIYIAIEVTPEPADLARLGPDALLPGLPVQAFFKTSRRSPLSYLTKPLTDYFAKALR